MKKKMVLLCTVLVLAVSAVWAKSVGEALLDAARAMDIRALQSLLADEDTLLDYRDPARDETALMISCRQQWLPGVKLLLEKGANPSFRNMAYQTALMFAAKHSNNNTIIKYLIENSNGINLDNQDINGNTALMYAIDNESIIALQTLLGYYANPNVCNSENKNAFMYAVEKGSEQHFKTLVNKATPNWEQQDIHGNTLIMLIVQKKQTNMLAALFSAYSEVDIVKPLPNSDQLLAWAMKTNQSREIIRRIIDKHDSDETIGEVYVNKKPVILWAIQKKQPNQIIGSLMRAYDPDILMTVKDENKRDIRWYIKTYKNDYARKVLDEITN